MTQAVVKKWVCLGGTGFIGRALLHALADWQVQNKDQLEVTVVSRKAQWPDALARVPWPFTAHLLSCDVVEEGLNGKLKACLEEADVVFYGLQFPGHPIENPRKGLTYDRYDLGGLLQVLKGLSARPNKPQRVLYLSGAGAGQGQNKPWYHAKDAAEKALADWASAEPKRSALALRPSVVFGKEDTSVNRLLSYAQQLHVMPLLGKSDGILHPIWVQDLAATLVECGLGAALSLQGAHNFPGREALSFRDLLACACKAAGVSAVFVPTPIALAKTGAWALQFLPEPPITPAAIDFLTASPDMPLPLGKSDRDTVESLRSGYSTVKEAMESYLPRKISKRS
jgi:nucleoside-diphosphate-sugar epimerase